MDHKRILRELNNETGHLVRREKLRTVQRKASNVSGLDVRPETAKIAAGRLLLIAKARFVVGMNVDENVSLLRGIEKEILASFGRFVARLTFGEVRAKRRRLNRLGDGPLGNKVVDRFGEFVRGKFEFVRLGAVGVGVAAQAARLVAEKATDADHHVFRIIDDVNAGESRQAQIRLTVILDLANVHRAVNFVGKRRGLAVD